MWRDAAENKDRYDVWQAWCGAHAGNNMAGKYFHVILKKDLDIDPNPQMEVVCRVHIFPLSSQYQWDWNKDGVMVINAECHKIINKYELWLVPGEKKLKPYTVFSNFISTLFRKIGKWHVYQMNAQKFLIVIGCITFYWIGNP